jgi:hypothetical protein
MDTLPQEVHFPKVGDADVSETYLTSYEFVGGLLDEFNDDLEVAE